jgi:transcriptional regulator with XRE-family HTH domain
MPRKNPARSLPYEQHVAANVALHREKLGLTYERLAERMSEVGCPIQPSAIFKVEKADPPRRITVNELIAFHRVLGVTVTDLLEDPSLGIPEEVWRPVHDVEDQQRVIDRALYEIDQIISAARPTFENDPRLRSVLRRMLADGWGDWPEVRDHFKTILRPTKTAGVGK